MKKMKASTYFKYGGPEVLSISELPIPSCDPSDILIRVRATTVNRSDCAMLTAKPFIMRFFTGCFRPKQPVLGSDFAGEVVDVGSSVSKFKSGDSVFGFHDMGLNSHAEYLVIKENAAIEKMPKSCSFIQAAGLCEGAHYAYFFLDKLKKIEGKRILVNGGTGAIGSALIQILKSRGAKITATSRTEHLEVIKSLGAEKSIDYTKEDFTKLDDKFDMVFDAVGKSTFGKCKHLLKQKGIYVSSELGPYIQNIFYALITPWFGGRKVIFPIPSDIKRSLAYMKGLFMERKFDALKDKEYPLEEISNAFAYVLSGQKVGNVFIVQD